LSDCQDIHGLLFVEEESQNRFRKSKLRPNVKMAKPFGFKT